MNRRGFIGSILAACTAPAVVRADSLMQIVPRETKILTLEKVKQLVPAGSMKLFDSAGVLLASMALPPWEPASEGGIKTKKSMYGTVVQSGEFARFKIVNGMGETMYCGDSKTLRLNYDQLSTGQTVMIYPIEVHSS